jgi:hypothetical protein
MKNRLLMMLVCSPLVLMTGCGEDTVNETSQEVLDELALLKTDNSELSVKNSKLADEKVKLAEDKAALLLEVGDLKDGMLAPYDFTTQCASIDVDFDYLNPNAKEVVQVAKSNVGLTGESCLSCHTYDGSGYAGVIPPHTDYGDCAGCHAPHTTTPGDLVGSPTDPTHEQPVFKPGAIDGKTGASGLSYYSTGSYLNAEWLVAAVSSKIQNYRWAEAAEDVGVTTLAQACVVENREHMKNMFPNDGKAYMVESAGNYAGAKLIATVNKYVENGVMVETPNVATFGWGVKNIDGEYFSSVFIGKNNTCFNAIMNGNARLSFYEYDETQFTKTGFEEDSRNRGARLIVTTDYTRTGLFADDWATPVPGAGIGEAFAPEDIDWNQVGACNITFKVEKIIPLG